MQPLVLKLRTCRNSTLNFSKSIISSLVFFWQVNFFLTSKLKHFLGVIILFMAHQSFAQKVVKKSIISPSISLISIDASNCFEIYIDTQDTDEMGVAAKIEGEYQNDLQLNIEKKGTTIHVNTGFNPDFINPNDKLSAHKVVSISLHIVLPKNSNVQIYGNDCNINIIGVYDQLNVALNDGFCTLNASIKKATVDTQSGNISLKTKEATIQATSKFGRVKSDSIPTGKNLFILSTVTGNIVLNRIE